MCEYSAAKPYGASPVGLSLTPRRCSSPTRARELRPFEVKVTTGVCGVRGSNCLKASTLGTVHASPRRSTRMALVCTQACTPTSRRCVTPQATMIPKRGISHCKVRQLALVARSSRFTMAGVHLRSCGKEFARRNDLRSINWPMSVGTQAGGALDCDGGVPASNPPVQTGMQVSLGMIFLSDAESTDDHGCSLRVAFN